MLKKYGSLKLLKSNDLSLLYKYLIDLYKYLIHLCKHLKKKEYSFFSKKKAYLNLD